MGDLPRSEEKAFPEKIMEEANQISSVCKCKSVGDPARSEEKDLPGRIMEEANQISSACKRKSVGDPARGEEKDLPGKIIKQKFQYILPEVRRRKAELHSQENRPGQAPGRVGMIRGISQPRQQAETCSRKYRDDTQISVAKTTGQDILPEIQG